MKTAVLSSSTNSNSIFGEKDASEKANENFYMSSPFNKVLSHKSSHEDSDFIATNFNTPQNQMKLDPLQENSPQPFFGSFNEIDKMNLSSSSSSDTSPDEQEQEEKIKQRCCQSQGNIHCCDKFEERIFNWIEKNVPEMVCPSAKMDLFFDAKRGAVRSLSFCQSKNPSLIKNLKQNTHSGVLSQTSILSSFTSLPIQDTPELKSTLLNSNAQFSSDEVSSPLLLAINQPQLLKKSNLLQRRMSQIQTGTSSKPQMFKTTFILPLEENCSNFDIIQDSNE